MTRPWILAAVLLCLPLPAASMNKCVSADGRVTYTSDPCPHDAKSAAPVKLNLPGGGVSNADTPEAAYLRSRRAFDEGLDVWLQHLDMGAAKSGRDVAEPMFQLMKKIGLRDFRIVDKSAPEAGKVALKVEATGRNVSTGKEQPAFADVLMVRKSGKWLVDTENWKMQ